MKGARLPKLPKSKTDCPLGTECLLRNFQSVITQCLRQISNACDLDDSKSFFHYGDILNINTHIHTHRVNYKQFIISIYFDFPGIL